VERSRTGGRKLVLDARAREEAKQLAKQLEHPILGREHPIPTRAAIAEDAGSVSGRKVTAKDRVTHLIAICRQVAKHPRTFAKTTELPERYYILCM
jgi:hypothetical protein